MDGTLDKHRGSFLSGAVAMTDENVLTIQMAKDAAKFGIRSWVLLLVAAIITALMGVLLIANPFESTRIRHVLTGMTVVLEGIMKYCVVLCTVKFPQHGKSRVRREEETVL